MSQTTPYRVRRALGLEEMTSIRRQIESADSGAAIVTTALGAVFTALLTPLGESLNDYNLDRKLDPARFAIPQTQWAAISDVCLAKADAYGARADVALDLINIMPSTYEDPKAIVPPTRRVDHRPYEHVLRVSREATDTIAAASHHCDQLATYFGADSSQYHDAVRSWQHCLSRLFSMGLGAELRVTREDELSLLVNSGTGFTYAIFFYPEARRCSRTGCSAVIDDDGRAHSYVAGEHMCAEGQHDPSYPLDAPQPGRWSLHS
jgi:hypothetical protein